MERFFGLLKGEWLADQRYWTRESARRQVEPATFAQLTILKFLGDVAELLHYLGVARQRMSIGLE